jgi:hypothetical protein
VIWVQKDQRDAAAEFPEFVCIPELARVIAKGKKVDFVVPNEMLDFVERTDFVAFVRRIGDSVSQVEDSHNSTTNCTKKT